MKVLFVDVDGVLNNNSSDWQDMNPLDDKCLKQLKWIVDETDVDLVLSTSWRGLTEPVAALKAAFERLQIPIWIGVTPDMGNVARSMEILKWLDSHDGILTFAVLDDDYDAGENLNCHFFLVDAEFGLTDTIAEAVIKFLQEK
jgi:hypothetical protein